MSLLEGKSCQKLRSEKERYNRGLENSVDHHVQILMEENMVIIFYTNPVFLFVGEVIVIMPCHILLIQRVVLAPSAHSLEGEVMVNTSMDMKTQWTKLSCCSVTRRLHMVLNCDDFAWLVVNTPFLILFRMHHVLSLLSSFLNFDNRVYVIVKVYAFYFVRPPEICFLHF